MQWISSSGHQNRKIQKEIWETELDLDSPLHYPVAIIIIHFHTIHLEFSLDVFVEYDGNNISFFQILILSGCFWVAFNLYKRAKKRNGKSLMIVINVTRCCCLFIYFCHCKWKPRKNENEIRPKASISETAEWKKVRNLCCLYCLHHDITCVTTILHSFHTYSVCVDLFDSYSVIFLFHIIAVVVMNTLINGKKYKEINRYSFIIILFRLVNNINILSFSGLLFATMFALDDDRMNFDWRMARIGK